MDNGGIEIGVWPTLPRQPGAAADAIRALSRRKHGFESRRARHCQIDFVWELPAGSEAAAGRYGCFVSSVQEATRVACDWCM
jgi:hypothetical protein